MKEVFCVDVTYLSLLAGVAVAKVVRRHLFFARQ